MLKRIMLIFLLCGGIISFLYATENTDEYDDLFNDLEDEFTTDESEEEAGPSSTLSLMGEHVFRFNIPVMNDYIDLNGYIKKPKYNNTIKGDYSTDNIQVVSNWEFKILLNDDETDLLFTQPLLYPLENYMEIRYDKIKVSAGFKIYNWGTGDGFNPTDNLNPLNMMNEFEFEKIPVLAMDLAVYPFHFMSVDIVYVPFKQNDIFPVDVPEYVADYYPEATINVKDSLYILEDFVLAARLNFIFSITDFSISYMYNLDSYYSPEIRLMEVDYSALYSLPPGSVVLNEVESIDLVRKRIHNIGFDFRTSVDRFGLWGEVCYVFANNYKQYQVREPQLNWITGVDFNLGANSEYYFNFQYSGCYNANYDKEFYSDYEDGIPDIDVLQDHDKAGNYYCRTLLNQLALINEGITHGFILNQEYSLFDSFLTISANTLYYLPALYEKHNDRTRLGSFIFNPQCDFKLFDAFHFKIGTQMFYAWYMKDGAVKLDDDDFIGSLRKDSHIYLELSYIWNWDLQK
ncbi:MAG: hypothetical protein JXB88_16620 [Spirochaetales bacterium]|nr:hypothetical protein [Spirochaetales bacterium]